jgi:hypothetical protein
MAPEFHRVVPPAAERAGYDRTARTRTVVVRLGPGHNIGNAGGLEREGIALLVHDTTGRSVIAGMGLGRLTGGPPSESPAPHLLADKGAELSYQFGHGSWSPDAPANEAANSATWGEHL